MKMVDRKDWNEFRDSKMLWLVNRTLHIFGWAIVFDFDEAGNVNEVYPARVKFRGFDEKSESEGFIGVSEFMRDNADSLVEESKL